MPETTPSHRVAEAYFPTATPTGVGEPARDSRTAPVVRPSPGLSEAAQLLHEAQELWQESRTGEAEALLLRALDLYEQEDSTAECVHVLSSLASIAISRGDVPAGESFLQRALALANDRLGGNHPQLPAMLGGLAGSYLRRSEFRKAEPLLQQLLEIKRARGDDHPEVATVLASLATVHSAMGAHARSEEALRRVLAIREKTLAPNHFATMTTLEHLAESCAARGKLEEALTLLRRAMAMRERTLGISHPSVSAVSTRIADLELLSSNEEPGWGLGSATLPGPLPQLEAISEEPRDSDLTLPRTAVELIKLVPREVRADRDDSPPDPDDDSPDRYEEWGQEFERAWSRRWLAPLRARAALVTAYAGTPRGRLTVLAIGVVSLLTAFALAMRTPSDVAVARADASIITPRTLSAARSSSSGDVAPAPEVKAPPAPARGTASADPPRRGVTAQASGRRSAPSQSAGRVESEETDPVRLPNAPKVGAFEVPIDRAPIAFAPGPVVASTDFTPSRVSPRDESPVTAAADQPRRRTTHAVLPNDNPAPAYPRDLLRQRIQGEVVAEFLVDVNGRVDTRTVRILSSPDERFSVAVREVLPRLRFLPAEKDGVKTEEWVEMPFRFVPQPR